MIPPVKDACAVLKAPDLTSYTSDKWEGSESRAIGLGTYTCTFEGSVAPEFGSTTKKYLDVGTPRIYLDKGQGSIGFVSPSQEGYLLGNMKPMNVFPKDTPFQVVITLTPRKSIGLFDSSKDALEMRFTNQVSGETTTSTGHIKIQIIK